MRIMRISNNLVISLSKLARTWIALDHNRPDIVFEDKENKNYLITVIACPSDRRVDIKQEEKVNKYLDLTVQIKELRKMNSVKVVLLLNGALGIYTFF